MSHTDRAIERMCLNSRDELLIIDLPKIAAIQANGNYTRLTYIEGDSQLISLGLSKLEESMRRVMAGRRSPFVRLGRSLIINQAYLSTISVLKQRLVLSDHAGHSHTLAVPKQLLRQYKDRLAADYSERLRTLDKPSPATDGNQE